MAQEWYYTRNGQKHGPISGAELKQLAAAGKLGPTDHVWKQGMAKWMPARSVKGLLPAAPVPPPPLPQAVPVAADAGAVVPPKEIEEVLEVLPADEPTKAETTPPANPSGLWGFLGKVKETAQKVKENVQVAKESVQRAKEAVRRPTSSPSAPTDPDSGLHVLEKLGFGRVLAKNWLICNGCKTKLKLPPPEWGRFGICPGCNKKIRVPLNDTLRDGLIRELAELLHLDITSPTIQQSLGYAVDVIYPTATGGTISFLQMKVLADQIRQNSVKKALEEGRMDKLIEGELKVNLEDPLVVAAGTPWKLFHWFFKQFGDCHSEASFEGHVGHPNPEVNAAYFIFQNNDAYPDDPCTKYTMTMLENLLRMAKEHQDEMRRQAELELQKRLLQQQLATQEAMREAAYQQAAAAREQQYQMRQQPSSPAPAPAPSSSPQVTETKCLECFGKGWYGGSNEIRCPRCGGHGVIRH